MNVTISFSMVMALLLISAIAVPMCKPDSEEVRYITVTNTVLGVYEQEASLFSMLEEGAE